MFDKLTEVKENFIKFSNFMSESPGLCVFFSILCFFMFYLSVNSIVNSLFRVHQSKSARRKIMKEYSFWQKAALIPHKTYCLHAKRFCARMVNYLYAHAVFFAIGLIYMIIACFVPEKHNLSFYFLLIQFLAFALPFSITGLILEEKPWLRSHTGYRFEKYHHTKEFEKLI